MQSNAYILLVATLSLCNAMEQYMARYPGPDYSGICLDVDDEKLSFVNDSCKTTADCFDFNGINSTACVQGVCACNENYAPDNQTTTSGVTRLLCNSAPFLGQPCTSTCQKPLTCSELSSQSSGAGGEVSILAYQSDSNYKQCQCLPPYVEKSGECYLECKPDEFYADFQCKKRCASDEIVINGNHQQSCKKVANLGEACESKAQCSAAYALCQDGKCACNAGFAPNKNNDACQSDSRSCPIGEPTRLNGAVVECTVIKRSKDSSAKQTASNFPKNLADTCGDGQFCVITSDFSGVYQEGATGHCCPTPKPACLIGTPHPTAKCADYFTAYYASPTGINPNENSCPTETHSCKHFSYGGVFETDICCPDVCAASQQVLVNGRCYPRRDYGDQCVNDKQCSMGGVCENGVCTCGNNSVLKTSGSMKYCDSSCKPDEKQTADGQCAPALSLGAACDSTTQPQDSMCPINAHCSKKSNTCICDCGQVKLNDKTCGPQPKCNNPYGVSESPLAAASDSFTFCLVPGIDEKPLLSNAVKECASNQYCASYLPSMGVCCSKPEKQLCSSGTSLGAKCNPFSAPCSGDNEFCEKYLDTADSNEGYACCSYSFIEDSTDGSVTSNSTGNPVASDGGPNF